MYLTILQTAQVLKVSTNFVRKLLKEEKIKADVISGKTVIQESEIDRYISENSIQIEPDDHERRTCDLPEIVALSFFSGAMGLDIGMSQAGISAILACESNKECRMTIERNNPDIALLGDITKYTAEDILRYAKIPEGRKVDVIFGGPPCQAFSTAGKRKTFNDKRGNVFLTYIDIVESIKPTYVIIENVRGLLSAPYPCGSQMKTVKGGALRLILDRLERAGYTISFELYNTANFGVPQIRERVVIIGKLGTEKVSYLIPTNEENGNLPKWKTISDAFKNLNPKDHHYIEFPEKRLKYYRMLTEGQCWKDLPLDVQRDAMGAKLDLAGGKTGFYRRLSFDRPSPTLVTNPTMPATDLCHPVENRPLSVEEYRRIQGFPDDWEICGSILEQYRQIGNAVPIGFAQAIAKAIIADMKGEKNPDIEGFQFSRYKNTNETSWNQKMFRND